jgi:hypothetical protein
MTGPGTRPTSGDSLLLRGHREHLQNVWVKGPSSPIVTKRTTTARARVAVSVALWFMYVGARGVAGFFPAYQLTRGTPESVQLDYPCESRALDKTVTLILS